MKHLSEEELVLVYYREPGAPSDAAFHLSECAQCKADFDALAETLNACLDWASPEPPPDFGRSVWASLAPRLIGKRKPVMPFRIWFTVAAAIVLLVGAFVAGRFTRRPASGPEGSLTAGLSQQARARIFAITLADHLDRAEVLLTELANTDIKDPGEFASERERAQDLVREGRLMRQMVSGAGDSSTLPLLDDVERFVMELANSPDNVTPREMDDLKKSIGSGSLLFKVRIMESNLRSEVRRS